MMGDMSMMTHKESSDIVHPESFEWMPQWAYMQGLKGSNLVCLAKYLLTL